MHRIRRVAPVLLVPACSLALFACAVSSADSGLDLLRRVAANYREAKRFHLAGDIHAELRSAAGTQTSDGTFEAASGGGGRVRDQVDIPNAGMLRVSDGTQVWLYLPDIHQYVHVQQALPSPEQMDSTQIASMGGMVSVLLGTYRGMADHVDSLRALPDETLEIDGRRRSCRVLRVTYHDAGPDGGPASRTYWIDPERLVVLKQQMVVAIAVPDGPASEQTETYTFRRAALNAPVAASLFTFTPPAGARQVDQFTQYQEDPDLSGQIATDFTLPDLAGHLHRLSDHRGSIVMLDFWATWCGPCRVQMPAVDRLYQEYRSQGLVVYAVNQGESAERARAYFERHQYTTTALLDPRGEVGQEYQVRGMPTLVIVDRQGKIVAHYLGLRSEDTLREGLKKAGIK